MGMRRVLVIDEDQSSIGLFGKALEPQGIDVFVIETPDKGIEKAIEVEPDLIYVNLIFQESNGLKVSKLIHAVEKLKKVPIVMLISHKRDLDPKYTTTIGVVDVLIKPLAVDDILAKTMAILGEAPSAGYPEEEPLAEMLAEEEMLAAPEEALASGQAFSPAEEPDFVREADRLIDQAITRPEEGRGNIFELEDDVSRDDVIHLRRPETAEPGGDDSSDYKSDEEIEMEERNLFEDGDEKKEDAKKKSFAEEFEDTENEEPLKNDYADDDVFDDEVPVDEKAGKTKKILMAAGGVLVIAVLAIGAYQAKKMFFKDETVKVPAAAKKEVVKENLPPPGAPVGAPAVPSPDAKVLPPADVTAKTEPAAAPAVAPAPATQKEQEKPKAAPAAPAEQKAAVKEPEKPKAAAKKEAEPKAAAKEAKAPAEVSKKAAKANGSAGFAVQAGYFSSEKNAEALASKLKEKGYEAYVLKNETPGKGEAKTFYRVLIGKFSSGKKAAVHAREMKKKENLPFVVYRG